MDKRFVIFIIASIAVLYFSNSLMPKHKKKNSEIAKPAATETFSQKPGTDIPAQTAVYSIKSKTIQNDNLRLTGTNEGLIKNIVLKKFENDKKNVDLVWNNVNSSFFDLKVQIGRQIVNFNQKEWDLIASDSELKFINNSESILVSKTIQLDPKAYTGKIEINIENKTNSEINLNNVYFNWGPLHRVGNEVLQAVVFNEGKITRIKPKKKDVNNIFEIKNGWIGARNQYFCSIFYGNNEYLNGTNIIQNEEQTLDVRVKLADAVIPGLQNKKYTVNIYFGPQNYQELKNIGYKLNRIVDFGMFHIIGVWMLYVLKFFYSLTKNYGYSIILLTLLIRAILWWPTQKSYTSMKKMQTAMNRMQPRLKTLKEIYKDNPQKLNEETMKLYKEYQINPMGGCLPMLLQMPIFFALYATLSGAVELKGAQFIWIWKDLSLKDPMYILPVAMGLTMFIQNKMSNAPAATPEAAAQQKMMLYVMPIMLTVFAFVWPSGLLLYWVISNIVSIGQQVIINRYSK